MMTQGPTWQGNYQQPGTSAPTNPANEPSIGGGATNAAKVANLGFAGPVYSESKCPES